MLEQSVLYGLQNKESGRNVAENEFDFDEMLDAALRRKKDLEKVVAELSGPSRRNRQSASSIVAQCAAKDAKRVAPYADALVDALDRPEAQTRWECLEALACIVAEDSRSCDKAVPGAEAALFDEDNGFVRLSAMRFLCKLGATTEKRSEKVWPLIDEGIQCYHGDLEFQDMLVAVIGFSEGKLAPEVKKELKARMSFDAANSKGALQKRAQQIVDNVK